MLSPSKMLFFVAKIQNNEGVFELILLGGKLIDNNRKYTITLYYYTTIYFNWQ